MTINISLSIVVALIVFIHALLFLVLILISPQLLIKLLNFSLLLLLMIPLCINSLVSYAKIFPVMFFLIGIPFNSGKGFLLHYWIPSFGLKFLNHSSKIGLINLLIKTIKLFRSGERKVFYWNQF